MSKSSMARGEKNCLKIIGHGVSKLLPKATKSYQLTKIENIVFITENVPKLSECIGTRG